jgi:hypothetical protein
MRLVATPQPNEDELQEIGRRLCKLVPVHPEEPISAMSLRCAYHDPICDGKPHMRYALALCAGALAALELPAEVQEARDAVDEYVSWSRTGRDLRIRLAESLLKAKRFLEDEAARREQALAEATTDVEREQGLVSKTWPSPESLRAFPSAMRDVIGRDIYCSAWTQKVLHDLPRLDADARVELRLSPIKIGLAKALERAGYDVPTIATVTEPFAQPGSERRQARNTVTRRLESTTEDLAFVPRSDATASSTATLATELERPERFAAGVSEDVRCVVIDWPKYEDGEAEAPASPGPALKHA